MKTLMTLKQIAIVSLIAITGCVAVAKPTLDIALANKTNEEFVDSNFRCDKHEFEFGYLGSFGTKTYVLYPYSLKRPVTIDLTAADGKVKSYTLSVTNVLDKELSGELEFDITTNGIIPKFTADHSK